MDHISDGEYRYDLKKACTHCPFRKADEGIKFSCVERATEIEELAYRQGFVCHKHGESDDSEDGGIHNRADGSSQHCFGALWMNLRDGWDGNIPFTNLDEDDQTRWWERMSMDEICAADDDIFDDAEQFVAASA